MVFILLALFASWPYFEKFKEYHFLKRLWIGSSIILLLGLGIMDIVGSDEQAKADKREISNQTDKISTLSNQTTNLSNTVTSLSDRLKEMREKQDVMNSKEDGRDKKQEERFREQLNSISVLLIQQQHGDIAKAQNDTVKAH